jgi:hypothetical protein
MLLSSLSPQANSVRSALILIRSEFAASRVKLFQLLCDMRLPGLATGGEGWELLRRIKYEALREFRCDY